ncbi:MAG: glycosyltransferase [Nitrosomonadales bacterium]|nr:glycosyltransferase [Nitrosomonadales bacterium]
MQQKPSRLIVHAPSVHHGGGLALLKSLLSAPGFSARFAQLDRRARDQLQLPPETTIRYVRPAILSRLGAEWRLWRTARENDVVLCFHGLPPLLPSRGHVVVFLQNRILVTCNAITAYPIRTRMRLRIERWILRTFSGHADKFIVQTPSMARDTRMTLGSDVEVVVLPFSGNLRVETDRSDAQYDFVYVASDESHKNHAVLLEAWRLLAEAGFKPALALTVPGESPLAGEIEALKQRHGLNISNLGKLQGDGIQRLYGASSALIFPSLAESLGLPLIEAARHGLPILAPEMDYVRDVVDPAQTFDPHSPISIARAVRRFMGKPEPVATMRLPEDFMAEVLK